MRYLTALAALVLVLALAGQTPRSQPEPAPTSHFVLVGDPGGRAVRSDSAQPQFLGGWWKTFKKVVGAILDFIDALIDATLPGDGKEGGDDGGMVLSLPAASPARSMVLLT